MATSCPHPIDNSFGPWAKQCRGAFDFTLLFEDSILSIPLTCICLLVLPLRLAQLSKSRSKVSLGYLQLYKKLSTISLAVIQFLLVVFWAVTDSATITHTKASIAAASLTFAFSIGICLLSWYEHSRSIRPSFLLNNYLALSIVLDVARARTLWMLGSYNVIPILFTCSIALRCVMLVLESAGKRSVLVSPYKAYPEESLSGPFSRGFLLWLRSLLVNGYNKALSLKDLPSLDHDLDSEQLSRRFQVVWDKVPDKTKIGALMSAWISAQSRELLMAAIPRLCLTGFTFAQPFLLTDAVALAAKPNEPFYNNIGYGLIGAFAFVYGGMAIANAQYELQMYRAATMMRGCLIPSVFSKTLRINSQHTKDAASLTLMSTDIENITGGIALMHELWASIIEASLATFLLGRQLGAACGVAIGFAIVALVCTVVAALPLSKHQASWTAASQKRVATTSNTLGNMKWLRFSGLNDVAWNIIERLRLQELTVSTKFRTFLLGLTIISTTSPVIAPVLTFATYCGLQLHGGDALTISRAFTSLTILSLLSKPLSMLLATLAALATTVASFGRIQDYLNSEEKRTSANNLDGTDQGAATASVEGTTLPASSDPSAELETFTRSPITVTSKGVAHFDADSQGTEVAAIHGFLKWPDSEEPTLDIDSWVIHRHSLNLILGPVGCGKTTLLKALLGESGGFIGMVNRPCMEVAYCDQSPWLPNDTISHIIIGTSDYEQEWYNKVLNACALDDDMAMWPNGDNTLVGSKGITLSGGQKQRLAIARALYSRRPFVVFDGMLDGLDAATEERVFDALFSAGGLLREIDATVIVASSDASRAAFADHIIVMNRKGQIAHRGDYEHIRSQPNLAAILSAKPMRTSGCAAPSDEHATETTKHGHGLKVPAIMDEQELELTRRVGDLAVYKYYARSAGAVSVAVFVLAMSSFAFCEAFPKIWLKWWADANTRDPGSDLGKWLGVYAALAIGSIASLYLGGWQLFVVTIAKSGLYFHTVLAETVGKAPMSLFTTVDLGVTINRFSQDLQLLDMELPSNAIGTAISVAFLIAQAILIAISTKWIAISFPLVLLAFYLIQRFYLRTSRQMRILDIEHKAPLYSQFQETLNGIVTIRAFEWQKEAQAKNIRLLDESQRPFYLLFALQRWLILSVDLVIALLAVLLMVLVTTLREQIGPGYAAIALVNIIGFDATAKAAMQTWVQLEVSIGAIARIKYFTEKAQAEGAGKNYANHQMPRSWPNRGALEIRDLYASYSPTAQVLKGVSIVVQPGERVAICGRTGSGKSSLALALLRMLNIDSGSIIIDDTDITAVPHEQIRKSLVGVPQEAYIFDGSVRMNIDPTAAATDDEVRTVLQAVRMWDDVQRRGGIEIEIDGTFFSHGQTKLLALARAMLRKGRLLILDEITSGLDAETSSIVDQVVATWFKDWTVIAVAHKLGPIVESYDKVAVLDGGYLLEFGDPKELLGRDQSAFRRLYEHSGAVAAGAQ